MSNVVQKPVRELIKELAIEFDLSYADAEKIIDSQFKFLKEAMGRGVKGEYDTFDTVLLRRLGTFIASKPKIDHMTSKYLKKSEDEE